MPLFKPAWQFGDVVDAVWDALLGVFGAGPEKFVAGHGRQELEPALVRVEREDATGPLAVSQVEVLRVASERVRAVVSPRNRERLAGADDNEPVSEVPRCGGSHTPAAQLFSCDRCLAVGHFAHLRRPEPHPLEPPAARASGSIEDRCHARGRSVAWASVPSPGPNLS